MEPQRLTALDATFLELEEHSAGAHMHIGSLLVFDPLPGGARPSLDRLAEHLGERLALMPRYAQRLSEPRTGGLRWPRWVEVPGFHPREQLIHAALPAPGGEPELLEWAGEFWSHRLDRTRPLWETALVEGLEGGRWALCMKTHHCLVDGVGSADAGALLLDTEPEPRRRDLRPFPEAARPERHRLADALRGGAHATGAVAGALDPRHAGASLATVRSALSIILHEELLPAPQTSINVPVGARRRIAALELPLEDARRVARGRGGKVNDLALTLVTTGLRELLLARGEDPPHDGLRAMMPVNTRAAGAARGVGNHVTSLFPSLPVAVADGGRRFERVIAESSRLKAGSDARGASAVVDAAGLLPPALHSALASSLFGERLFNVTVTNVPGPRGTLYALGAPMVTVFGLVPLASRHSLGFCIVSYDGLLTITVNADRDAVPDLETVVEAMCASWEELREHAFGRELEHGRTR